MVEEKGASPEGTAKKNKVVLLGNQGVGKTSILHYFVQGTFNEDYTVCFFWGCVFTLQWCSTIQAK